VRGIVPLGKENPEVVFYGPQEVLVVKLPRPCFDQFGERARPQMNMSGNYLMLLIPGRCAAFAKITIPVAGSPFSGAAIDLYDPISLPSQYVSSAAFDYNSQTIYYTSKVYRSASATLLSIDATASPMKRTNLSATLDLKESEAIIALANEVGDSNLQKWIYVIGSGSTKLLRLLFEGTTFISSYSAVLDPSINQVSSVIFYSTWLFYTTYEPDAKLVRLFRANFCEHYCGDFGYCLQGHCYCRDGYQLPSQIDQGCLPKELIVAELNRQNSTNATVALGILFGFALLIAVLGWFLWWRRKQASYQSIKG